MLLARNLPKYLWAEAISYATWLKNRMPSRATLTLTPYALAHNSTPNIARAHEFGCKVYVHQMDAGKLEACAEEAIFIGIDDESKAYRIYWPERRRVSAKRNVIFAPTTELVADGILDEGESMATSVPSATSKTVEGNVQNTWQPTATPLTPPRVAQPLPEPTTPKATRVRPPKGYYKSLHQGERAALAAMDELNLVAPHCALAAAQAEPTLKEALNGPDVPEWQEGID